MPQISESFTVTQPVDVVWAFFQEVPQVAECMPGVELLDQAGEDTFKGKMKVKIGPISANFQGEAKIESLEEATHSGTISARGADRQGGSRASAKVNYRLAEESGSTRVEITADITLQGAMAQFGRTGLIQEVSSTLTKEFAGCLEGKLGAASPEEAAEVKAGEVKGVALFFRSLLSWIRNLGKRSRS